MEFLAQFRMNKWYKEVCLLDQESVIHSKHLVRDIIQKLEKTLGEIKIINFVRAQVGEGLEQKQENLAEEVAKIINN